MRTLPDAFPLQWPAGWSRSKYRTPSSYKVTSARARVELVNAVRLLGGSSIIVSSNIELRRDGQPYANMPTPADPGVAVYWTRQGKQEVMACDRWKHPWENMRAIYYGVEGLRSIERAGATQILERAFQAFALPETAGPTVEPWRDVLGHHITTEREATQSFRDKAAVHHPDLGGNVEVFRKIERAYSDALKELRANGA